MKIIDVICHTLVVPDVRVDATSSAQDSFIVEIRTDEGLVGFGESDVNPWIARACIMAPGTHSMGRGVRDMLIGADPLEPDALWQRLYVGSAMNGRRGAVIHALGAVDIALYDIKGKALGVPVHRLLGEPRQDAITPYASLQPDARTFLEYRDAMLEWAGLAVARGFHALKLELTFAGPYRHLGLDEPDEHITSLLAEVRNLVGPAITLMVDVQYRWTHVDDALRTLRDWRELDVFFIETPLWTDDLDGYAALAASGTGVRVAAGEWLSTHHEFRDLIEHGRVDVVQPDVGRVGGFGEAVRVAAMAAKAGRQVVPHAWKSGLSIAAAAHLAAVTPHCPFIEFLPVGLSTSSLRRNLTSDELQMQDGQIPLPSRPGLGVEVDRDALIRFAVP